ncbi:hypothetical protein [Actinoplanes sp. NPDC026623]|uniref:hypothetical protein n=1 Tax=Actinoplanes sp. NPDC026623 TaxID=3155610 RepID=UPI0033DBBD67
MSLSPEQRDDLQRLMADELRAVWRSAVSKGASPATLGRMVDERRRAITTSLTAGDDPAVSDDADDLVRDPVDGPAVGDQL